VSAMGQGDAQPQSEGQAESQGPDLSQITGQLETLGTGLEEMRQFMQAQQQPAEPQQEEQGADEVDLSWLDQVSLEDPSVAQAAQAKLKAAETASQDGSENPGAGHLEGGSGPGPAPQSEEDIVKGIMGAGGVGSKVLNFRMGS
jgi:hypothetical protein